MYSYVKTDEFKALILVLLALCINVFSVFYTSSKANYEGLYKFKLLLVTSFVIITVSIMLWGATFNNIFGLNLDDTEIGAKIQSDIIKDSTLLYEEDCPPPGAGWEDAYNTLKTEDPEKAKRCLSLYNKKDTESDVYA